MYISDINIFLNNINNLVKKKGITKSHFYKEIGISAGSFGDWKSGKSKPSEKTLEKLSQYFNCTLDELILNNTNNNLTEQEKKLLNLFNKLDEDYKNQAISQIFKLVVKMSNEQDKILNSKKAQIAALGGGVVEIDEDLAKYIEENIVVDEYNPNN
ncbi:helix-turn-helix domain-containing protein [[Clostridium] colinum]|uniref:helix-turn-helix domain-containing protein n=1 Tax=[Clostridium] colinum TaxID=36835 RepID=UPI0020249C6A|nr:helix-turn-helix transcriptional regulator [[Clostridium] colinum]